MKPTTKLLPVTSLLFTFIWFISCQSQPPAKQKSIPLEMTATLGGAGSFLDTIGVIHIATTLYNPTADTVRFVSMTCSYEDFFTTNTDSFKIQFRYDCYSNYPTVITIPPKAKTDRYIMITRTKKGMNVDTATLKVGMYYLPYKMGDNFEAIIKQHDERQKADILWSNELDLKRLSKINY